MDTDANPYLDVPAADTAATAVPTNRLRLTGGAALAKAMTSGEAEAIYKKWFTQPIPPKGLNINFPISTAMQKPYREPNDKAFE